MRKVLAFTVFLALAALTALASCAKAPDPEKMLSEFIGLYSASGVIYSSECSEGENGYIDEELFRKIYIFEGELPRDYAIFLNSHTDYGAECGVFVCDGAEERDRVLDMCSERVRLLGRGNEAVFISRSGNVVFYSTMPDRARAEEIWYKIIRAHT